MGVPKTFKFYIRNRRKLFAAASTHRRRKSARTRFFANKHLQVKNQNLFFEFFFDNPTGEAFMYIM
jgi:hypothetical protein